MSLRILVTGVSGFTGRHLSEFLNNNRQHDLYYTDTAFGGADICRCDLRDPKMVLATIEELKPQQVYHLAGSFSQDYETDYAANVLSTRNILEAVLHSKLETRVLLVGSAAEYGAIRPGDNPVKETQPLNPASVYGLTKAYQTHLMNYYVQAHGMNIVMARPFNLLGRGLNKSLFVGRVYEQIDAFKKGEISCIELGNLDSYRDYVRVESAVEDYARIMEHGETGNVYHVASGKPVQMRELLAQILKEESVPFDKVREDAGRNPGKFNVPSIYADVSKIEALRSAINSIK